jgi:hypothetical protein
MFHRLRTIGLALAILIVGLGAIAAVTELEARGSDASPRLLRLVDLSRELEAQGLDITGSDAPATHPLLSVAGWRVSFDDGAVEVYVYQTIPARVADEQILQQHLMRVSVFDAGEGQPGERVTSARNLLLVYHAGQPSDATVIQRAARALAIGDH